MDFAMCRDMFANDQLYGWNAASGEFDATGCLGSLQVYDRFISERSFGQKKRVFTTSSTNVLDRVYDQVKVGDGPKVYLVEWANEDSVHDTVFGQTLSLREASVHGKLMRGAAGAVRGSGIAKPAADAVVATCWVDREFFNDARSSEFDDTRYVVYSLFFPQSVVPTSDDYFLDDAGAKYEIIEVFRQLELPAARVQRVG